MVPLTNGGKLEISPNHEIIERDRRGQIVRTTKPGEYGYDCWIEAIHTAEEKQRVREGKPK